MKKLLICATALFSLLGHEVRAQGSAQTPAPTPSVPVTSPQTLPAPASPARADPAQAAPAPASPALASPAVTAAPPGAASSPPAEVTPPAQTAQAPETSLETGRHRGGHRHREAYGSLFRHWCAYNCYAVPRCHGPSCYGRYGYSHFAYDEDIPFRHRWDRDASPIDNADAYVYRYTGEPIIRAFERIY